jgi:hypothetical protein
MGKVRKSHKRLRYVVIVEDRLKTFAVGTYPTFKMADEDARAWNGINLQKAYVVLIYTPREYIDLPLAD